MPQHKALVVACGKNIMLVCQHPYQCFLANQLRGYALFKRKNYAPAPQRLCVSPIQVGIPALLQHMDVKKFHQERLIWWLKGALPVDVSKWIVNAWSMVDANVVAKSFRMTGYQTSWMAPRG